MNVEVNIYMNNLRWLPFAQIVHISYMVTQTAPMNSETDAARNAIGTEQSLIL